MFKSDQLSLEDLGESLTDQLSSEGSGESSGVDESQKNRRP